MPKYVQELSGIEATKSAAILPDGKVRPGYANFLLPGESVQFDISMLDAAPPVSAAAYLAGDKTGQASARNAYIDRLSGRPLGTTAQTTAMRDTAKANRNFPLADTQAGFDHARNEHINSVQSGSGVLTSEIRDAALAARKG